MSGIYVHIYTAGGAKLAIMSAQTDPDLAKMYAIGVNAYLGVQGRDGI